jgi:CRP-like cAMP-binding protein
MAAIARRAPERPNAFARQSRFLGELASRGIVDEEVRRACTAVVLPAGSRRICADLPAARMFVVEDGVVLVRADPAPGVRSMVVSRCSSGAILPPLAAGEALQSLTDSWLTAVPHDVWRRLVASPEAAALLFAGLEETLLRQRESSRALAGVRHVDRVRVQLLELAAEHGRVCRDGIRIDLPLTHDLIADMIGSARETVTRALEELQRGGFVTRRGRYYQLLVEPESLTA